MKLTTLYEASTSSHAQHTRRAMDILKSVKSDATLDNLAWYAAMQEAHVVGDYSRKDLAWMFLEGVKPLKDPEILNNHWELEFTYHDEDGRSAEQANKIMANQFKEFFGA